MAQPALIGVTEARTQLGRLVDELEDRDVVMLRLNRPVAMLVHPSRIERLIERVEDLEDQLAAFESLGEQANTSHGEMVKQLEERDDRDEARNAKDPALA